MYKKYHFSEEDVVRIVLAYHAASEEAKALWPECAECADSAERAFKHREAVIIKFSEEFNCSPASVRGKLVVEKRYIARQYIHKRAYKANKERVVERLEMALGLEQGSLDSLEKINRKCVENLVQGIKLAQNGVVNFDFGMFFEYVDSNAAYSSVPEEFKLY